MYMYAGLSGQFFHISEIELFCFVVALSDLVHCTMSPSVTATSI